jgi:hypothetical protein
MVVRGGIDVEEVGDERGDVSVDAGDVPDGWSDTLVDGAAADEARITEVEDALCQAGSMRETVHLRAADARRTLWNALMHGMTLRRLAIDKLGSDSRVRRQGWREEGGRFLTVR